MNCLAALREIPDKYFDLPVCDIFHTPSLPFSSELAAGVNG